MYSSELCSLLGRIALMTGGSRSIGKKIAAGMGAADLCEVL